MRTEDVFLRLLAAFLLSGVIGFERERSHKPAGFRTHILVGMGAALAAVCSVWISQQYPDKATDPSRIAAQIVTGIGFLGAGVIMQSGVSVLGLTTAASLWMVACVGMAAGLSFYEGAVIGTGLSLLTLLFLNRMDTFMKTRGWTLVALEITADETVLRELEDRLSTYRLRLNELTLTAVSGKVGQIRVKIKDVEQETARDFMMEVRKLKGVRRIDLA